MATNFGKLNFSTAFNPTSAFPLDARSYFESYEAALAAAQTAEEAGSSNTVYHYGEILTVYDKEESKVAAYQITPAKELAKLAETGATGDLAGDVATLQGKVAALETAVGNAGSGLVKDVTDLKTLTGTLSTGLGTLSSTVSTISGKVTTLEGTVSTISTTVGSLSTRLGTAEGEIDALQTQIGGLTGAMHFIGTSTTDPTEGATVSGHDEFEAGDVCLFEGKEYVYDGADWQELGDEGSHLTKTEAAATYVPLTRTINGHALSANVTISSADIADLSATISAATTPLETRIETLETDKVTAEDITNAINALDVATVSVGAGETIKSITETDGKIVVEKQAIAIEQGAVTGLTAALAEKQTLSQVQATISSAITDLDLDNTYLKEVPQATAEALGGIKLGHTEGDNEHAVVLDGEGKAYVTVTIPEAITYSAGAGLTLSGTQFSIGTGAITNAMLAGSITNDKITSLNVQKLEQTEGDLLILDGGDAQ